MIRTIVVSSFLFLIFISCNKDTVVEPVGTPAWLNDKIIAMSNDPQYYGTKIFRYEWNETFVYYIVIPISSCADCEIYDKNGKKIQFTDYSQFQNFLINRKNEILVWEWKK